MKQMRDEDYIEVTAHNNDAVALNEDRQSLYGIGEESV